MRKSDMPTLTEHIQTVLNALPDANMTVHFNLAIQVSGDGVLRVSKYDYEGSKIKFSVTKSATRK